MHGRGLHGLRGQGWTSTRISEAGIAFVSLGLIAGNKDSIESALRWREVLRDRTRFAVVLNKRDDLAIYMQSKARQQFITDGVPEIEIPRLDERLVTELDRANWTIDQTLVSKTPHYLTQMMSRSRLRRYRDAVYAQFTNHQKLFLP
jgi:hypothetical protein